jgi:hypothetical protein
METKDALEGYNWQDVLWRAMQSIKSTNNTIDSLYGMYYFISAQQLTIIMRDQFSSLLLFKVTIPRRIYKIHLLLIIKLYYVINNKLIYQFLFIKNLFD